MITANSYFDEIYCINLQTATERWNVVNSRFKKNNIFVKRIDAYTPDHPECNKSYPSDSFLDTDINDVNYNAKTHAAYQSHMRCIKEAIAEGHQNILIFEDDVVFNKDFVKMFSRSIKQLPPYDVWLLGGFQHTWDNTIITNEYFYLSDNTMGLFAYALNRAGMIKFLELLEKYENSSLCIDTVLGYVLMPNKLIDVVVSYPFLVGHDTATGSITQNGKVEDYTGHFPRELFDYSQGI